MRKSQSLPYLAFLLVIFTLCNVSATEVSICTQLGSGTFELTTDLDCANDGMQLNGDNLLFDCQGHTINYSSSGAESDRGIEFWGTHSNITVKNCIIKMTNTTSANLYRQGITIYDNKDATIYNTTVEVWGSHWGIEMWGASGPTMDNINLSSVNVISHGGDGISFSNYAQNGILENSNVTALGWGVSTWTGANNIKIINNNLTATGSGAGAGIYLQGTITGANISGNTINSAKNGMYITGSATGNKISNNNILSSNGYGIRLLTSGNVLDGNTISSASTYGIWIDSANNNISNMDVESTSQAFVIYAGGGNIRVENSNFTSSAQSNTYIVGSSNNVYMDNVEFSTASGSNLYFTGSLNNLTVINSNFSSSTVKAISQSNGGLYWNISNNVITTPTGIVLKNVNNSYINDNDITTTASYSADFEGAGIYLTGDSNSLNNNTISTSGSTALGMIFSGATNSDLSNSYIETTGGGSYGIYISNGATGIDVSNTTSITHGTGFAPALYNYGSNNNFTNINATTYGAGSHGYGNYPFAFWIGYADKSYVKDCVFNAVNVDDIGAKGSAGYLSYLTNISYNELVFHTTDYNQSLEFYWYMDAQVNETGGSPVESANVTIYDVDDNAIYSELTNANGDIIQQTVKAFLITNGTTQTDYTPHNITVTKADYTTNSSLFNLTSLKDNVFWSVTLSSSLDVINPDVTINTPLNQTYTTNEITFNVTATDDVAVDTCLYSLNGGVTNYSMSNSGDEWTDTNSSMSQGSNTVIFYCNDTSNNLNNTEQVTFFIDSLNPSVSSLTESPSDPATYSLGQVYEFNATITDDNLETVLLEFDGVNYTATNLVGDIYNVSFSDLSVNSYNYRWFANDTLGNANNTETGAYTINKATSQTSLTFDVPSPQTYGTAITPTCSVISGEGSAVLKQDGVTITSGVAITLGADTYSFNCSLDATTNYTASSNSSDYTIDKADPSSNMAISGTTPIIYPTTSDFSESETNTGDGGCSYSMDRSNGIFGVGVWTFNYSTSGCVNYTAGSTTKDLTVNQNTTYILSITGTTPITYGTTTNVAGGDCPAELSCSLDKANAVYGAGTETFNYSTSGNTNYSANSITKDIIINKATPTGSLTSDLGWTINESQSVTIGLSESNNGDGGVVYVVYRDSVSKGTGETWSPALGTYDYILNTTGGANYSTTASMDSQTLTVNDITNPNINLVYPTNTSYTSIQTELNFTRSDTNLAGCWYSIDGGATNSSYDETCVNVTGLDSGQGSSTWIVYANDTSGNENQSSVTFFVDSDPPVINWVEPISAVTLTGGTTKTVNILFNASDVSGLNVSTANLSLYKTGETTRYASTCNNDTYSNQFNCSVDMQFYDGVGTWNINASIEDTSGYLGINITQTFTVNSLDYITQDTSSINWSSVYANTNDNEADSPIVLTNGGNQDYSNISLKAYNSTGAVESQIISTDSFSVDADTGQITGQTYMSEGVYVQASDLTGLDNHGSSVTESIYFYVDLTLLKSDTYTSDSNWVIKCST